MHEMFVDGPGNFTSDGNNIKFTLISVQKVEGDIFKPADVIQLVCTVQAASRIATFLHSAAEESKKPPLTLESQRTRPSSNDAVEERRALGKTNVPHQT
jgi:hypothetical protein